MEEEESVGWEDVRPGHTRDLGCVYCGLVCDLAGFYRSGAPVEAQEAVLAKIEAFELLFPEIAEWFKKQ